MWRGFVSGIVPVYGLLELVVYLHHVTRNTRETINRVIAVDEVS